MMTVRFPTGVSIRYRDANYVIRHANGHTDLYTKKDGDWIAQIPTGACVVEVQPASRVFAAVNDPAEIMDAALRLVRERTADGYELAKLKALLADFDARKKDWK